jgi:hypothetical protein
MELFEILQSRTGRDGDGSVADKLERLTLVCAAMWELLRDRSSIPDEDLLAKIREIDLRDGVLDGQRSLDPLGCPRCGRANNRRRQTCLYCEADLGPKG